MLAVLEPPMSNGRPMVRQPASKMPNMQKKHLKQLAQKSQWQQKQVRDK